MPDTKFSNVEVFEVEKAASRSANSPFAARHDDFLDQTPRLSYDLILAEPTPPPPRGKLSFIQGWFDHRTDYSGSTHKEGLRELPGK